jgi:hypothetical protein
MIKQNMKEILIDEEAHLEKILIPHGLLPSRFRNFSVRP